MIALYVEYAIRDGCSREDFYRKLIAQGVPAATRGEDGCLSYRFLYPAAGENSVILLEAWRDERAQLAHKSTPQFTALQQLKAAYVAETSFRAFEA
ncbi:MAG: antibiotic biosynthesis monooxygenase [Oscillospiraceae bacterium]|nr:antibiotic biosynthesis monooxygenase [Oscillospiraceae bacterium]